MMPKHSPACPKCGTGLRRVTQSPHSQLNSEQFDAIRAGDWYCEVCPSNGRGRTSYCYWWNHELAASTPAQVPRDPDQVRAETGKSYELIAEEDARMAAQAGDPPLPRDLTTSPSYLVTNGAKVVGMFSRHEDALACAARFDTDPPIWVCNLSRKVSRQRERRVWQVILAKDESTVASAPRDERPRYREACPKGGECMQGCLSREPCVYEHIAETEAAAHRTAAAVAQTGEPTPDPTEAMRRLRFHANALGLPWMNEALDALAAPPRDETKPAPRWQKHTDGMLTRAALVGEVLHGESTPAQAPREHHLTWNGTEWVDDRCGCRYHPDDDNGAHGGAPHVRRCEQHRESPQAGEPTPDVLTRLLRRWNNGDVEVNRGEDMLHACARELRAALAAQPASPLRDEIPLRTAIDRALWMWADGEPQGNIERMLQAAAEAFDAGPTISREVDEAAPCEWTKQYDANGTHVGYTEGPGLRYVRVVPDGRVFFRDGTGGHYFPAGPVRAALGMGSVDKASVKTRLAVQIASDMLERAELVNESDDIVARVLRAEAARIRGFVINRRLEDDDG